MTLKEITSQGVKYKSLPWKHKGRGGKTSVARLHCYPESYCTPRKFLRVQQKNLLNNCPNLVWGQSGQIEICPDSLTNLQPVLIKTFQIFLVETVRIFPDDFSFSGRFKLSGFFQMIVRGKCTFLCLSWEMVSRALSGKFLRVKSFYPESFWFLRLWKSSLSGRGFL